MNYHGRSRIDPTRPQAQAVCDRCGTWVNHVDLRRDKQWGGAALIETGFLVCERCLDVPQQQLRSIIIPADPVPIRNPRVEVSLSQVEDYRITDDGDQRITDADDNRILEAGEE